MSGKDISTKLVELFGSKYALSKLLQELRTLTFMFHAATSSISTISLGVMELEGREMTRRLSTNM